MIFSLGLKPDSHAFHVEACILICYYLKLIECGSRRLALMIYCHLMSHDFENRHIIKGKLKFNSYLM